MALNIQNMLNQAIGNTPAGATPDASNPSAGRRPDLAVRQRFAKTMENMREAMELSLADRLLNQAADDTDDDEKPKGMSMDTLGMNMLTTLAKLNAITAAQTAANAQATQETGTVSPQPAKARSSSQLDGDLGALASQFESGGLGSKAVAWDRTGGTSYGIFQLSSKQGSLQEFLTYLDSAAPQWSKRLREAGPADTGSRHGAMPAVWKAIAGENPQLFESLQRSFVVESHYRPAATAIAQVAGLDAQQLDAMPRALREVIFSTAVQHGPSGAARIFEKASQGIQQALADGRDVRGALRGLIERVYDERGNHFGSSEPHIRQAVRNRFVEEKKLALAMLADNGTKTA